MGLVYERVGTGPPLVLLHGLGHRRQAWYAVVSRLAPQRDLILVDLPSHGESPPLDTTGRSVRQALIGDLLDLLDELGLDYPHLAGNSLGGWLALEAAASGRAASVTAFSPAGFWRTSRQFSYARAALRTMHILGRVGRPLGPALSRKTAGRALIYAVIVSRPSRVSPVQAAGDMAAFLAARKAADSILSAATPFTDFIPANVPVTIAWGTRDRLLSPRQALVAKERLPAARLALLPGCGHVPMTDDPHLVADILLRGSRAESGLVGHLGDGLPVGVRTALPRWGARPPVRPRGTGTPLDYFGR
ncbi:alpha/beta fold hydrolase [Trebonia kvetii]|uniref:Alpha/beta fold hydrolase n=1 Tax=Trebonia kvetii TaxID=2480626 RepID=A0A6P2BMC4_9ACTN|nr:alpha/beta fold hydrolase [Trebonia kvetii]TVZ00102.1 alpha/beta fold hydrolase [Trebonia kvetii]